MIHLNSKHPTAFAIAHFPKILYVHSFFRIIFITESEGMVKHSGLKMESCILFLVFNGTHTMCASLTLVSKIFCILIG